MAVPFLRTPYNYDVDEASLEHVVHCEDPSLTQQHFADEVDINRILDRFAVTGVLSPAQQNQGIPQFGDFTGNYDYQTMLNMVREADASFLSLDPKVRARFANDPHQLLSFLADPANQAEAVALGLVNPPPAPPAPPAHPAPSAP